MTKYCMSTSARSAVGGTGRCVSVMPGRARLTSSGTKRDEQTLTRRGTIVSRVASPRLDRTPRIQRGRHTALINHFCFLNVRFCRLEVQRYGVRRNDNLQMPLDMRVEGTKCRARIAMIVRRQSARI